MKTKLLIKTLLSAAVLAINLATPALAAPIAGQGTWETTLKGRDISGNAVAGSSDSAVFLYDASLNVTWLRNADMNGFMIWSDANDWANNLTVGGFSDWRLPIIVDTGTPGCDWGFEGTECGYNVLTATSEMAHLYYVTLGNKAWVDTTGAWQPGYGLTNTGDFQSLHSSYYWFGNLFEPVIDGSFAWYFGTNFGNQDPSGTEGYMFAMAVRPGDVLAATVPEPESLVLALTGMASLCLIRRRRAVGSSPTLSPFGI